MQCVFPECPPRGVQVLLDYLAQALYVRLVKIRDRVLCLMTVFAMFQTCYCRRGVLGDVFMPPSFCMFFAYPPLMFMGTSVQSNSESDSVLLPYFLYLCVSPSFFMLWYEVC